MSSSWIDKISNCSSKRRQYDERTSEKDTVASTREIYDKGL